jgi:hypothetical protein
MYDLIHNVAIEIYSRGRGTVNVVNNTVEAGPAGNADFPGFSCAVTRCNVFNNHWITTHRTPEGECGAQLGRIIHKPSGRSLGYGALAADAAKITPDKEPEIKTPAQWTLAGTSKPRLDVPLKVEIGWGANWADAHA